MRFSGKTASIRNSMKASSKQASNTEQCEKKCRFVLKKVWENSRTDVHKKSILLFAVFCFIMSRIYGVIMLFAGYSLLCDVFFFTMFGNRMLLP